MGLTLIKWRLREVMARYRIKSIDLAKEMGISPNAVSNLRKSDTMPRLDGESLNNLCNALNTLALGLEEEITPTTLLDYSRDWEPGGEPQSSTTQASLRTKQPQRAVRSNQASQSHSLLIVRSEIPDSA